MQKNKTEFLILLLGWLMMLSSAQAASFDCAKASTKVEHLICGNAELSKLDESLAKNYNVLLQDSSKSGAIKRTQKIWLRERNGCHDEICLKKAYKARLSMLAGKLSELSNALAPFAFTHDATLTGQRYIGQRKRAICNDFLAYLNHPRSNALFKPDGTLVRETEKFKSVNWEVLDKALYQDSFVAFINATSPNMRAEYMRRYADQEWELQRTLAYPHENFPTAQNSERWLYRLVRARPYTRNMSDPASKVELPTWFHFGSIEWLGYVDGNPIIGDRADLSGRAGTPQWLIYAGLTYAVSNSTYGDGKGAVPAYLGLDVHELDVDSNGQSFLYWICAYEAKNNQ